MREKLNKYFTRRKKEYQREQSRRLGEAGFLIGAAVGCEKGDDNVDILLGGLAGLFAVAIFEVTCPKTASIIKSVL